ncbi:AAA family ATPase [Terriglobus tenax]|uniref:AAA family ATPase n=1 Tax=Terriglobus tenax TaxID=1111115 RepID=UPI0021E07288|nr:AAA family ATPase [Terriglobus tenax]
MQIQSLELYNFRAFEQCKVEFAPITVLVGPNNAGKSSILSALRILSQTLKSVDPDTTLLLEQLGSYRDVVHGNKTGRGIRIRAEFSSDTGNPSFDLKYKYRVQRREVALSEFMAFERTPDGGESTILRTTYSEITRRQLLRFIAGIPEGIIGQVPVPFYHFLPRISFLFWEQLAKKSKGRLRFHKNQDFPPKGSSSLTKWVREIQYLLSSLQYLGPFREDPKRNYPFSGERPSLLESSGHGATDILMTDFFRRGRQKRELTKKVSQWLTRAGIADDIEVVAISDRQYDIRLRHPITQESSNLADVGFGASQILPVLIAGYDIAPGSLFSVEQPEIHLHPKAQAELGEFFGDLYGRKVQSVIETHSEHLIIRLQRKVALGEIKPEDIVFNYINPTKSGKEIVTLKLNEKGLFTDKWPNGFFEERMQETLGLAKAPLLRRASR